MSQIAIRYDDGVAYEKMMGTWSRAAGEIFLEWPALVIIATCMFASSAT